LDATGEAFGFPLEVDAEMVVYGVTEKGAHLTIQGEPVAIEDDGGISGTGRNAEQTTGDTDHLPSQPLGWSSRRSSWQIERNTKAMEPHRCDAEDA
jgi:hypothetical protein